MPRPVLWIGRCGDTARQTVPWHGRNATVPPSAVLLVTPSRTGQAISLVNSTFGRSGSGRRLREPWREYARDAACAPYPGPAVVPEVSPQRETDRVRTANTGRPLRESPASARRYAAPARCGQATPQRRTHGGMATKRRRHVRPTVPASPAPQVEEKGVSRHAWRATPRLSAPFHLPK